MYFEANYAESRKGQFMRLLVTGFTIICLAWIWRRYELILLVKLLEQEFSIIDTLVSTGLYRRMLLEMAV
jgi:hypothetical protein